MRGQSMWLANTTCCLSWR